MRPQKFKEGKNIAVFTTAGQTRQGQVNISVFVAQSLLQALEKARTHESPRILSDRKSDSLNFSEIKNI